MLRLTLTPGDYFTINGNIVVQRPLCLTDKPAPSRRGKWFLWDQGREDAARHMRRLLREIETPENRRQIEALRVQLARISRKDAPDGQEAAAV